MSAALPLEVERPANVCPGLVVGEMTVVERCEDRITPTGAHLACWLTRCLCGRLCKRTEANVRASALAGRNMACRLCQSETMRGNAMRGNAISRAEVWRERTKSRLRRLWAETGMLYSIRELDSMTDHVRAAVGEYLGIEIEDFAVPTVEPTWKENKRTYQKDESAEFIRVAAEAFALATQSALNVSVEAREIARQQYERACGRKT